MSLTSAVANVVSAPCTTPWCMEHGPEGCLGRAWRVPGTAVTVWLSRPPAGGSVLTVDGPGIRRTEVPVPG